VRDFEVEPYPGRATKRDTSKDQAGTVLVFKPGVSKTEAELALRQIQHLLEHRPHVNTFNPEWGGPVWYVP
jgi:hypothetical protein